MSDFAASAMMRLIHAGLKRQGIALAAPAAVPGVNARLPLTDKRAALFALQSKHGLDCLLRIGEAVDGVAANGDEAVHTALLLARDPIDLLERWQRLERFIHSRHRIAFAPIDERTIHIRHYAIAETSPPLPAEDALVFGVLVSLIERIGAIDVRAKLVDARAWARSNGRWRALNERESRGSLAQWCLTWTGVQRAPLRSIANPHEASFAKQLAALFADDPTKSWTLANASAAIAISSRTLQRRLHDEATTFQRVLRETRVALAAKFLATGDIALAEIAYRAGFADQAHLQREFRVAAAMTPTAYRQGFGASGSPIGADRGVAGTVHPQDV